ncbi:hypothetical protein [Trichlorobacter ammonificans]|uniref:Uncharacterized protein n=1 Tax=Trichlorobacter ammonificans TaxID=2916410 RepID=A0ABN8HFJ9_9BACT|nr:hypothetical protein [Trichlorobacter ammonificans]CAH2031557.1 conserved protein of unknown function [Trichlorobacter ammonificans]
MSVRDMQGNPRIWERLTWADLSSEEQQLWSALGWQQAAWDRNSPPPSADKEWSGLTPQEQAAAAGLGFSEGLWNATEDA